MEQPEPDKPPEEMTRGELDEFRHKIRRKLRELERPGREKKLRQGRVKPHNQAEWAIFAADLKARRTSGQEGE
jgi:hypothetical protein